MKLSSIELKWLEQTKHFKGGYDFFKEWRTNNLSSPTHLVVFEYLVTHKFKWENLRSTKINIQPHYQYGEINKLYEMDMSIIGITLSQLNYEGSIHQFIREMATNSISRQLKKIKKRVTLIRHINWEDTLTKILRIIVESKSIEMNNNNEKHINRYFSEKGENDR